MCDGVLRIKSKGLITSDKSLPISIKIAEYEAFEIVERSVIRAKLNSSLAVSEGLWVASELVEHISPIDIGIFKARIKLNSLFISNKGFPISIKVAKRESLAIIGNSIVWVELNSLLISKERLLISLCIEVSAACFLRRDQMLNCASRMCLSWR